MAATAIDLAMELKFNPYGSGRVERALDADGQPDRCIDCNADKIGIWYAPGSLVPCGTWCDACMEIEAGETDTERPLPRPEGPDRPIGCPECGRAEHSCRCGYFA